MSSTDKPTKKRQGGSAAKYDPKKARVADPRRSKLHVNDPKSLRGFAMLLATYEGNEGHATIELHRLFTQYMEVYNRDCLMILFLGLCGEV
jgi:hypothetical protein